MKYILHLYDIDYHFKEILNQYQIICCFQSNGKQILRIDLNDFLKEQQVRITLDQNDDIQQFYVKQIVILMRIIDNFHKADQYLTDNKWVKWFQVKSYDQSLLIKLGLSEDPDQHIIQNNNQQNNLPQFNQQNDYQLNNDQSHQFNKNQFNNNQSSYQNNNNFYQQNNNSQQFEQNNINYNKQNNNNFYQQNNNSQQFEQNNINHNKQNNYDQDICQDYKRQQNQYFIEEFSEQNQKINNFESSFGSYNSQIELKQFDQEQTKRDKQYDNNRQLQSTRSLNQQNKPNLQEEIIKQKDQIIQQQQNIIKEFQKEQNIFIDMLKQIHSNQTNKSQIIIKPNYLEINDSSFQKILKQFVIIQDEQTKIKQQSPKKSLSPNNHILKNIKNCQNYYPIDEQICRQISLILDWDIKDSRKLLEKYTFVMKFNKLYIVNSGKLELFENYVTSNQIKFGKLRKSKNKLQIINDNDYFY